VKRSFLFGSVVAALGAISAGNASAYITFYGEDGNGDDAPLAATAQSNLARDEFFAAGALIGGSATPMIENLESRPPVNPNGSLTLSFGSGDRLVDATLRGGSGSLAIAPAAGRYSVPGGSAYWLAEATSTQGTFEIVFDKNPVVQFGFYGIDIGDFDGFVILELLDEAGNVQHTIDSEIRGTLDESVLNGSVRYIGVLAESNSEAFWGVRFRSVLAPGAASTSIASDFFAFDSFTVVAADRSTPGTPISAPGTLALLGTALLGLALVRRRA
jgi:hypothetical protein